MSEHQFVAFRAIDQPVNSENLEYMHNQSSRAEITAWSFENEYHFGNFRGDADEMLRRGYDVHFHYANFGIRKLAIRFPNGLPDEAAASRYFSDDGLKFEKDKQGDGGILCLEPFHETGTYDDYLDTQDILDRLAPLREEILNGDLRPLYLMHLIISRDQEHDPEETQEGPVPAGLEKLTGPQIALANLYGLSGALISAAAKGCPPLQKQDDLQKQQIEWLKKQTLATKDQWLVRLISEPQSVIGREILAEFRKAMAFPSWPTVQLNRTMAELEAASEVIQNQFDTQSAKKAAREKAKWFASIAANPEKILKETEKLVEFRSTENYRQIANLLSELREALASTVQSGLAEQQAKKLKRENPTLNSLTAALRREGFLPK